MKQKKLMLLGGLRYLIPVIEAAHREGYFVLTCDYLPDNIAHKYSDKYLNISIIDKEAVLVAAQREEIDGIISFAVDPGVTSAAFVQDRMGLPAFGPYESVCILQNKDRFRKFLADNGFNVPQTVSGTTVEEILDKTASLDFPLIVKPTDSAGSKGVRKVEDRQALKEAVVYAMQFSAAGRVIVEEFIESEGCPSDSDCFSIDGRLVFSSFSAQRFDAGAANPFTPAAYTYPPTMPESRMNELRSELQRLLSLLQMGSTVYNVETRIGRNGKAYIMEVSPRGGGNRLSEMQKHVSGVDLIRAAVRAAVGDAPEITETAGERQAHWAEIILHADRDGCFESIEISPELPAEVIETDLWVSEGDKVRAFEGANNTIGTLILKFPDAQSLEHALSHYDRWLKIKVK